jgi:hypothetical protein
MYSNRRKSSILAIKKGVLPSRVSPIELTDGGGGKKRFGKEPNYTMARKPFLL